MLGVVFEQFVEESPISVMARGLMEQVFAPERMDGLFETYAVEQYQQELLFSSQVDLMSLVVCGIQKSVHTTFRGSSNHSKNSVVHLNALKGLALPTLQCPIGKG
ncbi:MAG TPA: hypothetical protein V6D50_22780 [Chroococcales cyanobacterium]|jgi:hypothetical protein